MGYGYRVPNVGLIKGDIRSLDYSSCRVRDLGVLSGACPKLRSKCWAFLFLGQWMNANPRTVLAIISCNRYRP